MEEVKKNHSLSLEQRNKCTMTGVSKVVSATTSCISLITSCGSVKIEGANLKISRFSDLDGTFSMSGDISQIRYDHVKAPLVKRLFK